MEGEDSESYTPGVALTLHDKVEDRRVAMEADFQAHLSKPGDLADPALAIATLAGRVPEVRRRYSSQIEPIA